MCVSSKKCSKCGRVLPLVAFSRRNRSKDGLEARCKECRNASNRQWRKDNAEHIRDYDRQRYQENPEKARESSRKSSRKYRENNLEKARESGRKSSRKYYQENPEYFKAKNKNRRVRIAGSSGECTAEQWEARKAYFGHKCVYCGSEDDIQMDHKIPVANGGGGWASNMVPACRSCNCSKGTMPFLDFIAKKAKEVT